MLYSDYLDPEPRADKPQSRPSPVGLRRLGGRQPRWALAISPLVGGLGKDCPAANSVLEPSREREQLEAPFDSPSTSSALADRSWAVDRASFWNDLGSVLGNFVGGALFIGGMFLMPYAIRQVLTLL